MVVYGYHKDEYFHPLVARDIEAKSIPSVKVIKFQGEWKPGDDRHDYPLRRFIRAQPRVDYVIELHDTPANVRQQRGVKPPAILLNYMSKNKVREQVRSDIETYASRQGAVFHRYILRFFEEEVPSYSRFYDRVLVDYFVKYVTRDKASHFLVGLIEVLQQHPRKA